jgi:hypothetical protein
MKYNVKKCLRELKDYYISAISHDKHFFQRASLRKKGMEGNEEKGKGKGKKGNVKKEKGKEETGKGKEEKVKEEK